MRRSLLEAQSRLRADGSFATLIVFGGVDGAGKGEVANRLCEWMDTRSIDVRAYIDPTEEERLRPEYWRYWRDLPARGRMSIVLSGWHHRPFLRRVYGQVAEAGFERCLQEMVAFESTLARHGTLIVKFWMHLGQQQQQQRFLELERDPLRSWRVTEQDWRHWRMYDDFVAVAEHLVRRTSTDAARWIVVPGADPEQRELVVGTALLAALEAHLEARACADQVNGRRYREVKGSPVAPLMP